MEANHHLTVQDALDGIENASTNNVAGFINHVIKAGETLSQIAGSNNTSITKILENNSHPGPAIQDFDGNVIIEGKTLKIPSQANPQHANSIIEQKTKTKEALDTIYDTAVARLSVNLTTYQDAVSSLEAGIEPPELITPGDVTAVYRPYDATRRDHILIAFNDLLTSGSDMTITK